MNLRALFVLFATLCLGGCLKILGDFELDDGGARDGAGAPADSVPCWYRAGDGFCACQPEAGTEEYVSATTCEPLGSPASGKCCGYDGWPQAGTCLCAPVRCLELKSNPGSCVCAMYAPSSDFSERSTCYQGTCCQKPGSCACNDTPCDPDAGETEVSSCDVEVVAQSLACGDGGAAVTSCR